MPGMRRLAMALMLAALAGCAVVGGSQHAGPAAYLQKDATSVALVQLNEDDAGHYSGSILDARKTDSADGDPVNTENLTVAGQHHGSDVTLTIQAGLGLSQTWNGTPNGGTLALQIPHKDGSLQREEFTRTTSTATTRLSGCCGSRSRPGAPPQLLSSNSKPARTSRRLSSPLGTRPRLTWTRP